MNILLVYLVALNKSQYLYQQLLSMAGGFLNKDKAITTLGALSCGVVLIKVISESLT